MVSVKKIFMFFLILVFSCEMPCAVYAKKSSTKKRSGSSKKSTSGSKSKSKKRSSKRSSAPVSTVQTSSSDTESTTANTTATATTTTSETSTSNTTTTNETSAVSSEIVDVSGDEEWEQFKVCMLSACGGGDASPPNVSCYKEVGFDSAFTNCRSSISEEKRANFKAYYTGPYLKKEKKNFCEGDVYHGSYDETNDRCAVQVTYSRPKVDGHEGNGCSKANVTKTWYLDGKTYACTVENFGLGECYRDSDGYEAAKIQKTVGVINTVVGSTKMLLQAGVSVASGIKSHNNEVAKYEAMKSQQNTFNGTGPQMPSSSGTLGPQLPSASSSISSSLQNAKSASGSSPLVNPGKLDKAGIGINAAQAALTTGGGEVISGVASILTAKSEMKKKGDRVYGVCKLPTGEIISEGASIRLNW